MALVDFRYLTDALTPERGPGDPARGPAGPRRAPGRAAPRRLPGLHDVGRLAGLRRREDPPLVPGGPGRRLDPVQAEGRCRRRGRHPAGADRSRGDRARPDAGRRRQPALGRRARRSPGWPAWPSSTRTGSRSRRAPTTSSATRRSPGPSLRSGSRPASTSTTGSCSSSSCRPRRSPSARSIRAGWAGSTRSSRSSSWPRKFGVPVCPHAGGVGLCEYVQHLSPFDYIAVSGRLDGRMIEYVDHLHEHFQDPVSRRARRLPAAVRRPATAPRCTRPRSPTTRSRRVGSGGRRRPEPAMIRREP